MGTRWVAHPRMGQSCGVTNVIPQPILVLVILAATFSFDANGPAFFSAAPEPGDEYLQHHQRCISMSNATLKRWNGMSVKARIA